MGSRTSAVAAAVAGLAFIAYPALRPWSSEQGTEFATALASPAWPLTHLLAMLGFVLLAVLLRNLPADGWEGPALRRVELLAWLAAALLLPYYGAESLALHVLGQHVLASGDVGALAVVEQFRYGAWAVPVFAAGLALLAVVGVLLARGLWRTGGLTRVAVALVALGLVTFLPQFFAPAAVRVGHGVVLGVGLLLLAVALSARTRAPGAAS